MAAEFSWHTRLGCRCQGSVDVFRVATVTVVIPVCLNPLTLLLPYGYSYKHPVPDRVKWSFVIFDIRTL